MHVTAVIIADLQRSRFGLPAHLHDMLAGRSVLEHTVRRAAQLRQVYRIVLVHPAGQDPLKLLNVQDIDKPVSTLPIEHGLDHARATQWAAARKWSLTGWRGGLGNATVYDELLPAAPLVAALDAHHASSALLLRGEWCAFDTEFADAQIAKHLENIEAFKLCFTQAPPGLGGMVVSRDALAQLAEHHAAFGQALGYNPRRPALDPIGREVNIPIPAEVRDTFRRFIYDTPRSMTLLRAIADHLGEAFGEADATTITDACRAIEREQPTILHDRLPQQITLELTPRRQATGPVTPQHYVTFDRADLDVELAQRLCEQMGDAQAGGDVALRLGGLGDALLHPQWDVIVQAAHDAGVLGIAIETDLLCDTTALDRIFELPIDVVSVRFNADTAETYQKVMGMDGFSTVANNLRHMLQRRNERCEAGEPRLPWIVPHLTKTAETLRDMESFFDRWMLAEGHAVIQPAQSGCGLMPEQSPMAMAPPKRRPCRQLGAHDDSLRRPSGAVRPGLAGPGGAGRCAHRCPAGHLAARTQARGVSCRWRF